MDTAVSQLQNITSHQQANMRLQSVLVILVTLLPEECRPMHTTLPMPENHSGTAMNYANPQDPIDHHSNPPWLG